MLPTLLGNIFISRTNVGYFCVALEFNTTNVVSDVKRTQKYGPLWMCTSAYCMVGTCIVAFYLEHFNCTETQVICQPELKHL